MKKFLVPALIMVFALVLLWQGRCSGRDAEREKQEKAAYHKVIDSLTVQLVGALKRRDTLMDTVKVERVRVIHARARVDTVKLGFERDSTTGDSLHTALEVIATQDTLIGEQARHIKTLDEIVASDSGVIRLFQGMRVTDSTRIAQLEKPKGINLGLFRLKKPTCGPGVGVSVYPKINGSVGVYCVL